MEKGRILGAIVGATASGKTDAAVLLAQRLGAEIICMDSRQVFKGFRIGTAQPSAEALRAVRHHLVDFAPPEAQYNAAEFARDVKKLLEERPGAKFIIAGGTGLYFEALKLGLNPSPPASPEIREKLKKRYENKGPSELYKDALAANPLIEGKINPMDAQRLIRTLELAEIGYAGSGERVGGIGDVPSVWLDFPREELYGRINARVKSMMASGWIEEVMELAKRVPPEAPAWQGIGYAEIRRALEAGASPLSLEPEIALKCRHYAKRQITWFKNRENPARIDGRGAAGEGGIERIIARLNKNLTQN